MIVGTNQNISIAGIVCTLPGEPIKISQIRDFSQEDASIVTETTGIEFVHHSQNGQTASDLCLAAARHLLKKIQWSRETIDGIIFVTQTPTYSIPSNAFLAHSALGIKQGCMVFDINLGCSGYIYGLSIAGQMINSGVCKRVLLLVGDTLSHKVRKNDNKLSMTIGDAGTATALEHNPNCESMNFIMGTDGNGASQLIAPNSDNLLENEISDLYMNGLDLFRLAINVVPDMVEELLQLKMWSLNDIDYFLVHQTNKRLVERLARKVNLSLKKTPINVNKFGNTSGSTLPLLLADTLHHIEGKQKKLILSAFGAGYSWASVAINHSIPYLNIINE